MLKKIKNKINNPKFKHGTTSTIITFSVIAIVIMIYAISIILNNKYTLSLDMTSNKMFEISQQTKDYLKKLNNNITIRVFSPEKEFVNHPYYAEQYNQLNRILKMVKKCNSKISLVYDDIIKNPTLANKYAEEINQYSIVIESFNKKYKVLGVDNLFEIEQSYMSANLKASKAEQAIISAIISITSNNQLKIGILSGHQESDISSFEKLLSDNFYDIIKVNLLTSSIPQDLSLVVIAGPKKDFTPAEINYLNQYLNNNGNYGKNILYFPTISEDPLPNLTNFLKNWDINIEQAIAFDKTNMTQLGQYSSIVEYSDSELFKTLISQNAYTVFVQSRPINFINEETESTKHSTLLSFSNNAEGVTFSDSAENEEPSIKGPFAAIAKTSKFIGNKSSSVVVSGSLISIDGALLYQIPVSNADTYLTMINNITDKKDHGINIVSKEFKGNEINLKQNNVDLLRIIFIVIVPAVVIGCGLTVWSSRRNK